MLLRTHLHLSAFASCSLQSGFRSFIPRRPLHPSSPLHAGAELAMQQLLFRGSEAHPGFSHSPEWVAQSSLDAGSLGGECF